MDINKIRNDYNKGYYSYVESIPLRVSEDHVFDENLSVKENRRMVEEYNENIRRQRLKMRDKQNELYRKLTNDINDYLMETYSFNEKQAQIVNAYTYTKYHAFMEEFFNNIDSVAEMVESVINAAK